MRRKVLRGDTRLRTTTRRLGALACLLGLASLAAACSSSSSGGGDNNGGGSGTTSKPQTLTLAFQQRGNVFESDIYVAQAEGLFAKHGVNVKFIYNQQPESLLVSGQTDLIVDTATSAIATRLQGQDLRMISTQLVNNRLDLVTSGDIKTVAELKAKASSCKFGNQSPGSVVYAYTLNYMKVLGLHCTQITTDSAGDQVQGIVTKRFDAIATSPFYADQAVTGGGHILINALKPDFTFDPAFAPYALPDAITTGIFGAPSTLSSHAAAVKDFLAAVKEAGDERTTMSAQQRATDFRKVDAEGFATVADAALVRQIQLSQAPLVTESVSENLWKSSLQAYSQYQIPNFDASSPKIAYDQMVDTSYFPGS